MLEPLRYYPDGLSVPRVILQRVVSALLEKRNVPKGCLGVGILPITWPTFWQQSVHQNTALLVTSVEQKSSAEKTGFLIGDILLTVDGKSVQHPSDLRALLTECGVGNQATVRISRASQDVAVQVEV